MVPALRSGDVVLVWFRTPKQPPRDGAVVLIDLPDRPLSVKRLKRREALGTVWVEGDNPFGSTDSRQLGALPQESIRGVVLCRLWPKPGPIPRLQNL
jgi:hypothetical protein